MKKLIAAIVILPGVAFAQQTIVPESFGTYINSLPSASSVGTSDQLYIRQGGSSKQVPFSALFVPSGADPTGAIDSTSAINNALLTAGGRCVYLPAGTYSISSQLTLSQNNACLVGDGSVAAGTAIASQTTIKINSTTLDAVHVNTGLQNVRLANFTVDRTGTPSSGAGVFVDNGSGTTISYVSTQNHFNGFSLGGTSYSACDHCNAQSNYNHGFNFFSSGTTVQWQLNTTLSEFNNGWGYFYQATSSLGSVAFGNWNFITSFENTLGGIGIAGATGSSINDLFINLPVIGSDGNDEIQLTLVGGTNIKIIAPFIELAGQTATGRGSATAASHVGHGIALLGTTVSAGAVLISGGEIYSNSQEGIISNTQFNALSIIGVHVLSNAQSVSSAGININNTNTNATITGSVSTGGLQTYGILAAAGNNMTVVGNELRGNATNGCHSTAGLFVGVSNHDGDASCGSIIPGGTVTIANLPTCTASFAGTRATISNGVTGPTYLATVSTTGTTTVGVLCNGTNWIYD